MSDQTMVISTSQEILPQAKEFLIHYFAQVNIQADILEPGDPRSSHSDPIVVFTFTLKKLKYTKQILLGVVLSIQITSLSSTASHQVSQNTYLVHLTPFIPFSSLHSSRSLHSVTSMTESRVHDCDMQSPI